MFQNKIALLLRTMVLYPAAGFLSATVPFAAFSEDTGVLMIDLNAGSVALAATIWAAVAGGTFTWSRFIKRKGGAT